MGLARVPRLGCGFRDTSWRKVFVTNSTETRVLSFGELLWVLVGLPVALVAVAAWVGLGVARQGSSVVVAGMAGAMVGLPPLGLALVAGQRGWVGRWGLALAVWSTVLVVVFPTYFPGERAQALGVGTHILASVVGVSPPSGLADALDAWLPRIEGVPPVPLAEPIAVEAPVPAAASSTVVRSPPPMGDEVILPYEGEGTALMVPVAFENGKREVEVAMVFDTGASFTSLNRATLRQLGVSVPSDAPEVVVRTANGERSTPLVLIDRVWLGGFAVEGVTVGVCDECAHEDGRGLLGLNVSGGFLVTVDQESQELRLRPRERPDRTADVKYWVRPAASATAWPDGRIDVTVTLENNATKAISNAVVRVGCDRAYDVTFASVAPGTAEERTLALRRGTDCQGYTVELKSASW